VPISDLPPIDRLRENLRRVRERIDIAAIAAGRTTDEVRLIAVTKYVDLETTAALVSAGAVDLGESRPQSLWEKASAIPAARWHLIGHLQRNKIRRLLPHIDRIHSLDSRRLLDAIQSEAASRAEPIRGFLEVNLTQDSAKTGTDPQTAAQLLQDRLAWPSIEFVGLMGMASFDADPTAARREFAALRELRDRLAISSGLPLPELSMGMSGDFEAAIAEGATCVRIGSALFEGLER